MPSPESTGGAGYTFEDSVVAFYLSSLLVEGGARGISEAIISEIFLQRAALGEPLDDLIIEATDRYFQKSKLSLQVKQSPTLSSADTNKDFRETITASWNEFQKQEFRTSKDRIGLAAAHISLTTLRAARTTLEWARKSSSAEDFFQRLSAENFANNAMRNFVADIRTLLPSVGQSNASVWEFLKHFVILTFDTQNEGASAKFEATERLRLILPANERDRAEDLWIRLLQIARDASGVAGSFSRQSLIEQLNGVFDFTSTPSHRNDLERIAQETQFALGSIRRDVSGVEVPRPKLTEKIASLEPDKRFVQLVGEPGCGKSGLLRSLAEEHAQNGFAFVLTDKRLVGPGWPAFANHLGLSSVRLDELLVELSTTEHPTLFIDGIDRLEEQARQTVSDILIMLLNDPRLANWRVVASARTAHLEDLRVWLPPELIEQNHAYIVEVGSFDDAEAQFIAEKIPHMRDLLFAEGAAREIARKPFFTERLSRPADQNADQSGFASEISLVNAWLAGPPQFENQSLSIERRGVLAELGKRCARSNDRTALVSDLSANVLAALVADREIFELTGSNRYAFTHDIYLEWAVFGMCRQNGKNWTEALMEAGDRPGLIRVVELLSQFEFELGEDWSEMASALEAVDTARHWSRTWMVAPFSSPLFFQRVSAISEFLSESGRIIRLLSAFRAYKSIENPLVISGELGFEDRSRLEKFRIADYLSWPRPVRAWNRMLVWLLDQEWTEENADDVLNALGVWLNLFQDFPSGTKDKYAERLDTILSQREAYDFRNSKSQRPLGYLKHDFGTKLRTTFLRSVLTNNILLDKRLKAWSGRHRVDERIQKDVFGWSSRLAQVAPRALADFAYHSFISPLPSEIAQRTRRSRIGWSPDIHDWESLGISDSSQQCYPASPVQEPFMSLFKFAPEQALELVRKLLARSVSAWRELPRYDYRNPENPLPFHIDFPWGKQEFWGDNRSYGWYRGMFSSNVLSSALMAMEDWAFSELEKGESTDHIVRQLVEGHNSAATLGIAVGILLENVTLSPASAAIVKCQHLWALDQHRWRHDATGSHANDFGAHLPFGRRDPVHYDALKRINTRPTRQKNIQWLLMGFVLTANEWRDDVVEEITKFPENLPFTHEGQEADARNVEYLKSQAQEWATMADLSYYEASETEDGRIGVSYQPSEERVKQADGAGKELASWNEGFLLLKQAKECLETGELTEEMLGSTLEIARNVDSGDVFSAGYDAGSPGSSRVSGVAAMAAALLRNRSVLDQDVVDWAADVAVRASETSVVKDTFFHPDSPANDRPETFAALALAELIKLPNKNVSDARDRLIGLCFHPYKGVQFTAMEAGAGCWKVSPDFANLIATLSFKCVMLDGERGSPDWHQKREQWEEIRSAEREKLLLSSIETLRSAEPACLSEGVPIPTADQIDKWRVEDFIRAVTILPSSRFSEDEAFRKDIISIIEKFIVPFSEAVRSEERSSRSLLGLGFASLAWKIVFFCEGLEPERVRSEILPVFVELPMEARTEFLSQFANAYSCRFILDAQTVAVGTIEVILSIFEALQDDDDWKQAEWRDDFGLTDNLWKLVRVAMGANWDKPAMGSNRFANEIWSDAELLDPMIDWMLTQRGHLPDVMRTFLTHVERSLEYRSAEFLAARLEAVPSIVWESRSFWAQDMAVSLSALLQSFAERDAPLKPHVHRSFLQFLDHLVELGDRRSAALQKSAMFDLPRGLSTVGPAIVPPARLS